MTLLNQETKISINPNIIRTSIDNDLVMLNPEVQHFFGVNSVGADIWALLEKAPHSLQSICEMISEQYDIQESPYINDVRSFIEDMLEQKLLLVV